MNRLLVVVEGLTEQRFVEAVLAPHLAARNVAVGARRIGKPGHNGGYKGWGVARAELIGLIREDSGRAWSTMFDYYALPETWPGKAKARAAATEAKTVGRRMAPAEIADLVQSAILADLAADIAPEVLNNRSWPYIQMHEFEALVYCEPSKLAPVAGEKVAADVERVRREFETPEHIDDSPTTTPSHRLERIWPAYNKVVLGTQLTSAIGLATLRAQCPHFGAWLAAMESLGGKTTFSASERP